MPQTKQSPDLPTNRSFFMRSFPTHGQPARSQQRAEPTLQRETERESSTCHGRAGVHRRGTGICPSHYGPRRCAKRRASAESFHRCATAGAQSAVPAGAIGRFTRRGAWGHAAPRAMETPRRPAPISAWKPFRNALNEPSGQEASGVPFEAPLTQSLSRRGLLQASGGKGFWGIVQR